MKATRDQLKALVRELMIEILSEGLMPVSAPRASGRPIVGSQTEQRQPAGGRRRPTFDPRLDSPVGSGRTPTDALKEAIKREAGGNPVMADILADTAMTTLGGSMLSRDHMPGQQEQFQGDPTEIFEGGQMREDGSSHWADLAFMSVGKKSA